MIQTQQDNSFFFFAEQNLLSICRSSIEEMVEELKTSMESITDDDASYLHWWQ